MFHLLKRYVLDGDTEERTGLASVMDFDDHEAAMVEAKSLCKEFGWTVLVVQEVEEVTMGPIVVSKAAAPPPPTVVYRGAAPAAGLQEVFEEVVGPPRTPQVRPRLLVINRKATPGELVAHLMVVAEGRIVKNAFGALELADMPLTGGELPQVVAALKAP